MTDAVTPPSLSRRRPDRRSPTPSCAATSATRRTRSAPSAPAVVAELPDWEQLREAGRAIKERTLRHLDAYLLELEESVTRAGGVVHWARDAEECNRIVGDLIAAHGADEVVKAKSLTTEETGLNEALEARGIHAWETDLAQLIIQLGDDTPSHILVPAIHKNRDADPRAVPPHLPDAPPDLSDDPRELAEAARVHLRRLFLEAQVGISGANFAVAETGIDCRRRVRGQRPHVHDAAGGADQRDGDREGDPHLAGPRGLPAAAAALLDRRADEPVHVAVDRGQRGRRAARVPPRARRQRPHQRARRRDRPPGAELHPLLGLPERLPGLRAHRRARLRLRPTPARSARSSRRC